MFSYIDDVLVVRDDRRDVLAQHIAAEKEWFHNFNFGDGMVSPGRDPSAKKLHHLCLPADMSGLTVLDIGSYEGYFSFQCEKRNAARVVACDSFVWNWPHSSSRRNFDSVHQALDSKVEAVNCAVENLAAHFSGQKFDIVLFPGVLYHSPDMIGYLRNVAAVTKSVCILETFVDCLDLEGARLAMYEGSESNNDDTNWFGPNLKGTAVLARRAGFRTVEFMNMWDVNTREQIEGRGWEGQLRTGRAVFRLYI